jgi:uncharacterized protein YkwD
VLTGAFVLAIGGAAGATSCAVPILGCGPTTEATVPAPVPPTTAPPAPTPPPTPAQPTSAAAQARLAELVNSERTSRGLGRVQVRADVTAIAGRWSDSMARAAELSHDDAYFTGTSHRDLGAGVLGENVARAPDIDVAHAALMASEHHRDNILDARFSVIGIGATFVDGTWWITEDFLQPRVVAASTPPAAPGLVRTPASTSTTVAATAAPAASVLAVAAVPARSVAVLPRIDRVEPRHVATTRPAERARRDLAVLAAALVLVLAAPLRGELRRR